MNRWLARLADEFPEAPCEGTVKTDKREVLSVLTVTPGMAFAESRVANDAATRANVAAQSCATCHHRARVNTCGTPVAAGLLPTGRFDIVWPPDGHAANCKAFTVELPMLAQDRPYRLTPDQGDRRHAPCWDEAEIARFQNRANRFLRLAIDERDAEDLAERLALRDRDSDSMVSCIECAHYRPSYCGNYRAARLRTADMGRDLAALLQRCPGFRAMD